MLIIKKNVKVYDMDILKKVPQKLYGKSKGKKNSSLGFVW